MTTDDREQQPSSSPWDEMGHEHLLPIAVGMLREPLARRFIQKSVASGDNRVRTPEDVLGERLMRLGGMLLTEAEHPGHLILNVPEESRAKSLLVFAHQAMHATPYLWSEEVRGQLRNLEIPRHVLSPRLLPQPKLWFTWETGINIGGGLVVDFAVAIDLGDRFYYVVCGEYDESQTDPGDPSAVTPGGRPFIDGRIYEYGRVYPDDYPPGPDPRQTTEESGQLPSLLGQLAFLASPYIPRQQLKANRAARRESARAGSDLAEQEVSFIVLRRPEGKRAPGEDEQSVDWKHRWLVNGHLRAQWYPSEQAHRLIWIAPYMKGPEDAPLLEHAFKVAR